MNTEIAVAPMQPKFRPELFDEDGIYYPSTIENYMPENNIHFRMTLTLATMLMVFLQNRKGSYVFGDIMFYYEQGKPKKFVAPDIMVCLDKEKEPSKGVYKLWKEKSVPAVVIELASQSTWFKDVSTKVALYQKLGVKEYFVFDPEYSYLPKSLIAFRLIDGVFVEQEIENNRILSESLGLELVDTGETLRLFNPNTNEFLMTAEEMAAEIVRLKGQN